MQAGTSALTGKQTGVVRQQVKRFVDEGEEVDSFGIVWNLLRCVPIVKNDEAVSVEIIMAADGGTRFSHGARRDKTRHP